MSNSNNTWHFIISLDEFIDHCRSMIFDLFLESTTDNMSDADVVVSSSFNNDDIGHILSCFDEDEPEQMALYLSHSEATVIAHRFIKLKLDKKNKEEKYAINNELLFEMLESFNSRLISNLLNSLVNDGLLESAFDGKLNDFVFWPTEAFKKRNPQKRKKP